MLSTDGFEIRAKDSEGAWRAWEPFSVRSHWLPIVSAQNGKVGTEKSVPVSALMSAADPDGDTIVRYQLWDSAGGGYFAISGVSQPAGIEITIDASELANVTYIGATDVGAETVWARADDGYGQWGSWQGWTMDTVYRLDESVGTSGNDVIATPNLDTIYFGLQGDDVFNIQADKGPFVLGGAEPVDRAANSFHAAH